MKRTIVILLVVVLLTELVPSVSIADGPYDSHEYLVMTNSQGETESYRIRNPETNSSLHVPAWTLQRLDYYRENEGVFPPWSVVPGPYRGFQKLAEGDPAIALLQQALDIANEKRMVVVIPVITYWLSIDKEGRQWVAMVEKNREEDIYAFSIDTCQRKLVYKVPSWPIKLWQPRQVWPPEDGSWKEIAYTDPRVGPTIVDNCLRKQAEEEEKKQTKRRSLVEYFCRYLCH